MMELHRFIDQMWTTLLLVIALLSANAFSQDDVGATVNNRVLFISIAERAHSNGLLAISQSLLENHPSIDVHYASFPAVATSVAAISDSTTPSAENDKRIAFHPLSGLSYMDTLAQQGYESGNIRHGPGLICISKTLGFLSTLLAPWTPPEYMEIYHDILRVIEEVNPGLVVVDSMFRPAHDAVEQLGRKYVIFAPNNIKDFAVSSQPNLGTVLAYPL